MNAEGDDPPHAVVPPPAFLSAPAPAAVMGALPGARAVGGCVRDALADRPVNDVDVAAPLPPEAMVPLLRRAGLKVFETGLAHGTVTAVLDGEPVEVTSLRRDVATDGRHAEVAWTTDWREDAARRDFTVNAMSLAADGRLWDYFGGRDDLAAGRVRFVGDPETRLREDYLRALRFFRFQARYGRGEPDAAALRAIRAAVPGLARLSAERVWMEIKRLLAAPDPSGAAALMAEAGVLGAVVPEATELPALGRLMALQDAPDPLLRFATLMPPGTDTGGVAARLRMSGTEASTLAALGGPAPSPSDDDAALRRVLAESGHAALIGRLLLAEARGAAGDLAALRRRLAAMPRPEFPLLGRDVLALGVQPGPEVGRLLHAARCWWLDRGCVDSAEACRDRLRELAAAHGI
jgi:poly(A) polymerase